MHSTVTFIIFLFVLATQQLNAQFKKIDTTATFGSIGYRVTCNNKSETENVLTISPKGFNKDVQDMSFAVKGRLKKIIVDDLNLDGYPDLMMCVYSGANGSMGNLISLVTNGNNTPVPAYFPDIYSNQKISVGYKGNDEFTTLAGTLMQSFPVVSDSTIASTTTRVVQYGLEKSDKGGFKFKVLRSYEKK